MEMLIVMWKKDFVWEQSQKKSLISQPNRQNTLIKVEENGKKMRRASGRNELK